MLAGSQTALQLAVPDGAAAGSPRRRCSWQSQTALQLAVLDHEPAEVTMNRSMSASEPGATADNGEWRSLSACLGEDPELFFPVPGSMTLFAQLARAKAICRRCPVSWECLCYALSTGQRHGVWGGKSEEERLALRRRLPVGTPVPRFSQPAQTRAG